MFINGQDIALFNAEVTDDYEVGPASVTSNYSMSGGSTTPIGYGLKASLRDITLPIAFVCSTTKEAMIQRAKVQEEFLKTTVELYDDESDMYYSAVLNGISEDETLMEGVIVTTFVLLGIAHGKLVTLEQNDPFIAEGVCSGGQDCILSVTVKTLESDGTYKIGNVTFKSDKVKVGQKIEINGFEKKVYVNGGSAMDFCDIVSFPKVYTDKFNFFECKDKLTIRYYPVYK